MKRDEFIESFSAILTKDCKYVCDPRAENIERAAQYVRSFGFLIGAACTVMIALNFANYFDAKIAKLIFLLLCLMGTTNGLILMWVSDFFLRRVKTCDAKGAR